MKASFKKLNIISEVYERKTRDMNLIDENPQCTQYHNPGFISAIKEASTVFDQAAVTTIDTAAKNLDEQNDQAQLFSCALIY